MTCKGVCKKYQAKYHGRLPSYTNGYKRCTICSILLDTFYIHLYTSFIQSILYIILYYTLHSTIRLPLYSILWSSCTTAQPTMTTGAISTLPHYKALTNLTPLLTIYVTTTFTFWGIVSFTIFSTITIHNYSFETFIFSLAFIFSLYCALYFLFLGTVRSFLAQQGQYSPSYRMYISQPWHLFLPEAYLPIPTPRRLAIFALYRTHTPLHVAIYSPVFFMFHYVYFFVFFNMLALYFALYNLFLGLVRSCRLQQGQWLPSQFM